MQAQTWAEWDGDSGTEGASPGDAGVGSSVLGRISRQWAGVLPGPPLVTRGRVESQGNSGSVASSCPKQGPGKKLTPCPEAFSSVLTLPQRHSGWEGLSPGLGVTGADGARPWDTGTAF